MGLGLDGVIFEGLKDSRKKIPPPTLRTQAMVEDDTLGPTGRRLMSLRRMQETWRLRGR